MGTVTSTTVEVTFEQWRESTRAVCVEYEPRQDALATQLGQPTNLQEAAAFFEALTPLTDEYIDALIAIEVPSDRSGEVERTYELYLGLRTAAQAALQAASAGDQVGFESAAQDLQTQGGELEALVAALDLPDCVSN